MLPCTSYSYNVNDGMYISKMVIVFRLVKTKFTATVTSGLDSYPIFGTKVKLVQRMKEKYSEDKSNK